MLDMAMVMLHQCSSCKAKCEAVLLNNCSALRYCGGRSARVLVPMCLLTGVCAVLYPNVAAGGKMQNIAVMGAVGL